MSNLIVWGRRSSSNVQKVLWLCEELKLDYENKEIGGKFGGLSDSNFLEMNPNGKIPVISDDGFLLFESHTIMRYLSEKHDSQIIPKDIKYKYICDQWLEWTHSTLSIPMINILIEIIRTPENKRNKENINNNLFKANEYWSILDKHLSNNKWIAGTNFSLADISAGVWAWRRDKLPIEFRKFEFLDKWYEQLKEKKEYNQIVMQPLS